MMKLVYLLSDHDEYGSEGVMATMEPDRLPDMIRAYFKAGLDQQLEDNENWCNDARREGDDARLQRLLVANEEIRQSLKEDEAEALLRLAAIDLFTANRNPVRLVQYWGGMQLHIVPLEESA